MAVMWFTLISALVCLHLPSTVQFGISMAGKLSPCYWSGNQCKQGSTCGSNEEKNSYTCPHGDICCRFIPCVERCIVGDCLDKGSGVLECECALGYSGAKCDLDISGNCDFKADTCGWSSSSAGDFSWSILSGPTASDDTGPDSDHTIGNCQVPRQYIYTETSTPRQEGDRAVLQSPVFPPSTGQCMTFYYHMYGATIGTLKILLQPQSQATSELWTLSGDQGQTWRKGFLHIPQQITNYQILIEGIRGGSFTGDISIDDIIFHPCTQRPQDASASPGNCDFSAGLCNWNNLATDDFDWTLSSGSTPSFNTGPSEDVTCLGNYMYMEVSGPRDEGETAIFQSRVFQPSRGQCMTFYYHMYGSAIGNLSIEVQPQNQSPQVLWFVSGEQGQAWLQGVVAIPQQTMDYQVLIRGVHGSTVTGNQWQGDISIDDISFSNLCSCTQTPPTAAITADVPACENMGQCVAPYSATLNYTCNCPAAFTGDRCETAVLDG